MKNSLAVAMGRVSTAEQRQHGLSLTDQDITFRNYANKLGHQIVHAFSFNESASVSQKRTRFQEVIAYIKANDIGHLYVENTTRLSRDTVDLQYIKDLYENHGLTFHFISENYTLNKNLDGASKMFLIMRMMQGEMMIDDLRRKMRDTMLKKVERGEWPGRPLYGYVMQDRQMVPDEKTASKVQQIFRQRIDGQSLPEIAESLNKAKVRPPRGTKWHFQEIEKMLKQVGYIGQIKWKDIIYTTARHAPIISPSVFAKVQQTFTQSTRKNTKNGHLFSGMIRLDSRLFSPEVQKGHVYYGAYIGNTRKREWLSEKRIFELIDPQISALHWESDFGDFVRDTAKGMVALQKNTSDKQILKREKELSELRGKAVRVYDDRLDGTISKELYQIKSAEIQARQAEIENELRSLRADDRMFLTHIERLTTTFETLPIEYAKSDPAGKVEILKALCTGLTYKDGQLTPNYRATFATFINSKVDRLKRARVRDSSTLRPLLEESRTLLAA